MADIDFFLYSSVGVKSQNTRIVAQVLSLRLSKNILNVYGATIYTENKLFVLFQNLLLNNGLHNLGFDLFKIEMVFVRLNWCDCIHRLWYGAYKLSCLWLDLLANTQI